MKLPFQKRPHRSLTERIELAESEEEIQRLLATGDSFEDAAPATRSRWKRAAKKRRNQLQS